ncbi:MAG: helix-turn-helix domain-containing protein [Rhizobiaceae bacterium]|nr:helix-turn-helix domain-containing protein [Rhizobiaceae bacterium]
MARPSKYKPEFAEQARKLCLLGATNTDLADFFNVSINTIDNWAAAHEAFLGALKVGKEEADNRVERSLYQRAVGYTFESEKVFCQQGAVVRAAIREHVPPDTTAQIFWLKNRRKDEWRDKQEHGITDKDGNDVLMSPVEAGQKTAFMLQKAAHQIKKVGPSDQ